ncbi:MAG: DMT family transporter [Ruminococcus sp.]|nr:DMT family transporter [Ruminococcus sp.]
MKQKLKGNIILLITAIIWGTAFVAQSEGMNYVEPFTYNAVRTLIGGIVLIPIIAIFQRGGVSSENGAKSQKTTIIGGIVCGIFLFIAGSFQQCGIAMTTAGKAGFITALYVTIVPLIEVILYRKSSLKVWLCVFLALAGFYMLCIKEGFTIGKGDLLVLCGAFFYAGHIMVIDRFNEKNADGMKMSCIQFFTAGLLMTVCMFIFENPEINAIMDAKYTILYAGIMSCGAAYTLQIIGQRYTDPTSATLIMSLESVFAALSGWIILSESLSIKELFGCTLVFAAVILSQLGASSLPEIKINKSKGEKT